MLDSAGLVEKYFPFQCYTGPYSRKSSSTLIFYRAYSNKHDILKQQFMCSVRLQNHLPLGSKA
jgi:hypothetical protein